MSKLDILYQFDNNYAPFAGVSITTLFKNNQDIDELTVYMAAKDIPAEHLKKFDLLAKQYGRRLVYLDVGSIYQQLEEMGAGGWNGSLATWMKMFVMRSIPESVDQLLYIDSDTLVPGSLKELAELDLGEAAVGCVMDSISPKSRERLHLDSPYCNAGVIYFNLKYWRAHDVETQMLKHLKQHILEYPVNDQDLLNDYFRGKILYLSPRYNFQGIHYIYRDATYFSVLAWNKDEYYTLEEIAAARKQVSIIHFFRFCGEYPWQPGTVHPCSVMFSEALANSLWEGYKHPLKPLKLFYRLERILYRILPQKLFLRLHLVVSN